MMRKHVILCLTVLLMCSCAHRGTVEYDTVYYAPQHASGFDIVGNAGCVSRVVRVMSPWQGADSTAMELFIARDGELPPEGFGGQVIDGHASRLAVMSSSYVGLLSALGACDSVAAVSGLRFISDTDILERKDRIMEIGSDSDPDYEGLLACSVDLVLLYGITSSSPMEKRLKALGIPYFYMGEYLEPDPLGRAEWMVALAEIIGQRERGEEVFASLAHRYDSLKTMASGICQYDSLKAVSSGGKENNRPKVMLNVPYGDTWFMASSNSAIVRMIEDAGGEYIYKENVTNRSMPIDREEAFILASQADVWLDTGGLGSVEELERACPGFSSVKCVQNGRIYNNDARMSPGGGNEFWESSVAMPDVVLGDLMRILHPDISALQESCPHPQDNELYYYRRLE